MNKSEEQWKRHAVLPTHTIGPCTVIFRLGSKGHLGWRDKHITRNHWGREIKLMTIGRLGEKKRKHTICVAILKILDSFLFIYIFITDKNTIDADECTETKVFFFITQSPIQLKAKRKIQKSKLRRDRKFSHWDLNPFSRICFHLKGQITYI